MHVVVETPTYLKAAAALFSDAEMADIVTIIASDPDCGDVMQGTGGFRKVRVGRDGMGSAAERGLFIFFATSSFLSF